MFRHHLGEEAAVPPRPMLWDHIDNSLLLRQNETYRRRLVATRWVAAASLGLATLAGTGWWVQGGSGLVGPEVATRATATKPASGNLANQSSASVAAVEKVGAGSAGASHSAYGDVNATQAAKARSAAEIASSSGQAGRTVRPQTDFGASSVRIGLEDGLAASTTTSNEVASAGTADSSPAGGTASQETAGKTRAAIATAAVPAAGNQAQSLGGTENLAGAAAANVATVAAPRVSSGVPAASSATVAAAFVPAGSAALPGQVGLLAPTSTSLALTAPAALPNGLASLPLPAETAPAVAVTDRKWQYGASYAAGTFNPNINFSREGVGADYAYNPALGADSPALTEAAATEYRNNLRPGFSQRIALVAKRHLTGNWSLNTGAEFAQASANSSSTSAFVGEQLLDLGQFSTGGMRTTSFRYRTAGIPVSLSYSNAEKRGWSLYGRLGGVVSALLGVRSEVEGSPEATRTYSLASAGTPYRRVLGSIRGAAGAQYRPELGGWAFTLAPVAELGLVPLNANPAQSYFAQSRPYTFGLEASVGFGR
ncbi:hypothetical protein BEN48_05510 [Hymenobacter glacialis]|uniref:Outer membrane protein beta-barrel domain-containing protein n=1 Tax=Hymenobacter glacialis TaxID=1908236 RepID=A0A1G1SSU6_9BACT|nr:hypothetical protein BEN48_05510 [Hymenobacter glacialis]